MPTDRRQSTVMCCVVHSSPASFQIMCEQSRRRRYTSACSAAHFTCHWQAVVGYSRPQPSYALCLHFFFASTQDFGPLMFTKPPPAARTVTSAALHCTARPSGIDQVGRPHTGRDGCSSMAGCAWRYAAQSCAQPTGTPQMTNAKDEELWRIIDHAIRRGGTCRARKVRPTSGR